MGTADKLACGCKNHVSTAHRAETQPYDALNGKQAELRRSIRDCYWP
jgi:hypothetical protein